MNQRCNYPKKKQKTAAIICFFFQKINYINTSSTYFLHILFLNLRVDL